MTSNKNQTRCENCACQTNCTCGGACACPTTK